MLNKSFILVLLLLTFNFLLSTAVFGAIPQMINFQGRLTDDEGQPITGTRNFEFSIYNDPTSELVADRLWGPETQDSVPIAGGIFSVQLGSFVPIGQNVFDSPNCWLEIEVQGSKLTPRQQIIAHAYSYITEKSYTLTEGANVNNVSISTLTLSGSRMYLLGGEDGEPGVFYIERKNTNYPVNTQDLAIRLTGSGGSYDVMRWYGNERYDYSGQTFASTHTTTSSTYADGYKIDIDNLKVNDTFYLPSGTSVPASGYNAGAIFYETDTYTFWGSTETVVGIQSWVVVGSPGQ